jgi:hypothetical protein
MTETNLIVLARHGAAYRAQQAYERGREAAKTFYEGDLKDLMADAWLSGYPFILQSYSCPPEDPLHRELTNRDYQRGLKDGLKDAFGNKTVLIEGPARTDFLRIAVCRPGLVTWFLRAQTWWMNRRDTRAQARSSPNKA